MSDKQRLHGLSGEQTCLLWSFGKGGEGENVLASAMEGKFPWVDGGGVDSRGIQCKLHSKDCSRFSKSDMAAGNGGVMF